MGNIVPGGTNADVGSAPPLGARLRPRASAHSPAPRSTRMCREPVRRRWSHDERRTPSVTSGPAGATTATRTPWRARPAASPRTAAASDRPANSTGSLTRSSRLFPEPVNDPVTVREPGTSTENSSRASTVRSMAMRSGARRRTGGVVPGGDLQRAVELPRRTRRLRTGVTRHLDGHVDEPVVDRGVAAGQERPHLASQIGPVDDLLGAGVRAHLRSPRVGRPPTNLDTFFNGLFRFMVPWS